jgi:RNA polymerase sigma-70 factor (ECF subfamily)
MDFAQRCEELTGDLSAFCRYLTGDEERARDLFQDTWARALERREAYREDLSLRAWLLSIARNLWIDRARRAGVERRALRARAEGLRESRESPDPLPLREALGRLGEEDREAFLLYRIQGLSLREAARVLGTTPWAVRERLARAQEALERLLKID